MQGIVRVRVLFFLLSILVVSVGTYLVILFARGYRPNFQEQRFQATGILVATSMPDGAQVVINNQLKTATDNTLNLPPGEYQVEIRKDGFSSWKKTLKIEAEIVTRATAWLFPTVTSLKAITSSGVSSPSLSPEGNKVVYTNREGALTKIYILDLNESPLGLLNREARQVFASPVYDFEGYHFIWSPDSRQILAVATPSAYLLDLSTQQLTDVSLSVPTLVKRWLQTKSVRDAQRFSTLPEKLQPALATSAAYLVWSPKENKVLYTATASASIPQHLIRELPGSSTQLQNRNLEPGGVYVYDLEEDRNFRVGTLTISSPTPKPKKPAPSPVTATIGNSAVNEIELQLGYVHPSGLSWFSTSSHLLFEEGNKILIKEYDNQNQSVVYAGPMEQGIAYPYPSGKQMLILTNLTPSISPRNNLYAISLR